MTKDEIEALLEGVKKQEQQVLKTLADLETAIVKARTDAVEKRGQRKLLEDILKKMQQVAATNPRGDAPD